MRRSLVLMAALFATACASGPATDCAGFSPIRPTAQDVEVISEPLARGILAHNRFGQAHCGWQP